jgi:hypothetical protein
MYSAPTRVDTITNRKKIKGFNADTFQDDKIIKNKINVVVETDRPENEYFEESMKNPAFAVSKIKGADIVEKQMLHGYRYNHSIGDIDFVSLETAEFGDYGYKLNSILNIDSNWNWIVDEGFDPATWTGGSPGTHILSTGGSSSARPTLQHRTLDWHVYDGGAVMVVTGVYLIDGSRAIRLAGTTGKMRIQTNMLNTHYEFSAYAMGTNLGAQWDFALGASGYTGATYTPNVVLKIDYPTDTLTLQQGGITIGTHTLSDPFVAAEYHLYTFTVLGKHIIVKYDEEIIFNLPLVDYVVGDPHLIQISGTWSPYFDLIRMRSLKREVVGVVQGLLANSYRAKNEVIGSHGTQQIVYDQGLVTVDQSFSADSQMLLEMNDAQGSEIKDKTSNNNHGIIHNGSIVEDGMLGYGVELENGDIKILDDSSISDLSEFALHTRFRLQNMEEEKRSLQANPIISKGHEFAVYDYKKPDGLIAHFKFNDNYTDSSGYGHTITEVGTPDYVIGKLNKGVNFAGGGSEHLDVGTTIGDMLGDDVRNMAVSCWFKADEVSVDDGLWDFGFASAYGELSARYAVGNLLVVSWEGATTQINFDFSDTTSWHNLVAVIEENVLKVYLDGEIMGTLNSTTTIDMIGKKFVIGAYWNATYNTNGQMDDVRVYNKSLDANEVAQLYNEGNGTEEKLNLHRIAFEIYGELLIGESLVQNEWNEFWFLSEGKSSFIYRRDSTGLAQPEARKVLGELEYYLPLDDSTIDKSVNGHTSVAESVPAVSAGKLNNTYNLNGSSHYMKYGDGSAFPRKQVSISAWFYGDNLNSGSAQKVVAVNGDDTVINTDSLAIYVHNFGLIFHWRTSVGGFGYSGTSYTVINDKWYHVVGVQDNLEFKFYINGVLVETTTYASSFADYYEQSFSVGRNWVSAIEYFDGKIDEARCYSVALTEEQVAFLYSKGNYTDNLHINSQGYKTRNRESGLIAHYKLNGNAKDSSVYDQVASANTNTYVAGKIGQAATFDGITYFDGHELQHGYKFTAMCWARVHVAGEGSHRVILSKENTAYDGWEIACNSNEAKFRVTIQDVATTLIDRSISGTMGYTNDVWTHVAMTYENKTMKFYIDGVLVDTSQNLSLLEDWDMLQVFHIGSRRPARSTKFDGDIDDVRIYTYVLDDNEISAIHNSGNGTESESYNKLTVDHVDLRDKFFHPYKHMDSLYQVRNWKLAEDSINNIQMRSLIFNAPLEEGSGTDSHIKNIYGSYTMNAANLGGNWNTDTFSPLEKYYVETSGSSHILSTLDDSNINNEFRLYEQSYSIWIKTTGATSNDIYVFNDRTFVDTQGVLLRTYGNTSTLQGYLAFYYETASGTQSVNTGAFKYPPNHWAKVDITFSFGLVKIYINGDLVKVSQDSDDYIVSSGVDYAFYYFNTPIGRDRFKVWDRALTESEVKKLYISDPLEPYQLSNLVFSKKHEFAPTDSIFIENGLFGVHIHKGLRVEALKTVGGVDFKYFRDGWEDIGRLRTYVNLTGFASVGVKDFKIIETTPNKTVVRVRTESSTTQILNYDNEINSKGVVFIFDIIIESGKKSATLINRSDHHSYSFGLNIGGLGEASAEVDIAGFEDIKLAELNGALTVTEAEIPRHIVNRKNDNLIIGIGTTDIDSLYVDDDTSNTTLRQIEINAIDDDPLNEKHTFVVFANEYFQADETDLVFFTETEVGNGTGSSVADATASGGFTWRQTSAGSREIYLGDPSGISTLKKGSYLAWARLKGTSAHMSVRKDAVDIEAYGYNVGATTLFSLTGSYALYAIPFVVDDETADYRLRVNFGATTTDFDCGGVIPLANGQDGVEDLFEQGLTINNIKNIGVL